MALSPRYLNAPFPPGLGLCLQCTPTEAAGAEETSPAQTPLPLIGDPRAAYTLVPFKLVWIPKERDNIDHGEWLLFCSHESVHILLTDTLLSFYYTALVHFQLYDILYALLSADTYISMPSLSSHDDYLGQSANVLARLFYSMSIVHEMMAIGLPVLFGEFDVLFTLSSISKLDMNIAIEFAILQLCAILPPEFDSLILLLAELFDIPDAVARVTLTDDLKTLAIDVSRIVSEWEQHYDDESPQLSIPLLLKIAERMSANTPEAEQYLLDRLSLINGEHDEQKRYLMTIDILVTAALQQVNKQPVWLAPADGLGDEIHNIEQRWTTHYADRYTGYPFLETYERLMNCFARIAANVEPGRALQFVNLVLALARYPFSLPLDNVIINWIDPTTQAGDDALGYIESLTEVPLQRLNRMLAAIDAAEGPGTVEDWKAYLATALPDLEMQEWTRAGRGLAPFLEEWWRRRGFPDWAELFYRVYEPSAEHYAILSGMPLIQDAAEEHRREDEVILGLEMVWQSILTQMGPRCICAPDLRSSCAMKDIFARLYRKAVPDPGWEEWFNERWQRPTCLEDTLKQQAGQ
jgi:hypothetical protein